MFASANTNWKTKKSKPIVFESFFSTLCLLAVCFIFCSTLAEAQYRNPSNVSQYIAHTDVNPNDYLFLSFVSQISVFQVFTSFLS